MTGQSMNLTGKINITTVDNKIYITAELQHKDKNKKYTNAAEAYHDILKELYDKTNKEKQDFKE